MKSKKRNNQIDNSFEEELTRYNTAEHEYDESILELSTLIWLVSCLGIDAVDKNTLDDIIKRASKLDIKPDTLEKFL